MKPAQIASGVSSLVVFIVSCVLVYLWFTRWRCRPKKWTELKNVQIDTTLTSNLVDVTLCTAQYKAITDDIFGFYVTSNSSGKYDVFFLDKDIKTSLVVGGGKDTFYYVTDTFKLAPSPSPLPSRSPRPPSPSPNLLDVYTRVDNQDVSGSDIGSPIPPGSTTMDCLQACNLNDECVAVVQSTDNNSCYLKSNADNVISSNSRRVFFKPGSGTPSRSPSSPTVTMGYRYIVPSGSDARIRKYEFSSSSTPTNGTLTMYEEKGTGGFELIFTVVYSQGLITQYGPPTSSVSTQDIPSKFMTNGTNITSLFTGGGELFDGYDRSQTDPPLRAYDEYSSYNVVGTSPTYYYYFNTGSNTKEGLFMFYRWNGTSYTNIGGVVYNNGIADVIYTDLDIATQSGTQTSSISVDGDLQTITVGTNIRNMFTNGTTSFNGVDADQDAQFS